MHNDCKRLPFAGGRAPLSLGTHIRLPRLTCHESNLVAPVDPTFLAAVVSAIVAFAILGLDKFFIEPRKWLKRYQIRVYEKSD